MTNISRVCILALISLVFAGRSVANTIYVDTNATDPAHDGSSWCDAYLYLQDALAVATAGDEIRVAEGVYKPDQGGGQTLGSRAATFQLINGVTIAGGYGGCGGLDPDERDIAAYETILSGDLAGDDVVVAAEDLMDEPTRAENSYHVVRGSGTDESASLDGCTVIGGNANGSGGLGGGMYNEVSSPTVSHCKFTANSAIVGGGMYNSASTSTVTDCAFTGNSAQNEGGGMYSWNSIATVTNCSFTDNSVGYRGGGMFNDVFSDLVVTNCTFSGNSADSGFDGDGGGMSNTRSSPTVTDCSFSRNSASGHGGGMNNDRDSDPMVTNCMFSGNSAGIDGGGMNNVDGSDPVVTGCAFNRNSAIGSFGSGGGMYNKDSSPVVTECTFRGNSAPDNSGGGIYNEYGEPTITDCTFTANMADFGGGMRNFDSSATVRNCTFNRNWAIHAGGGMQNGGYPVVVNCMFIGNWTRFAGGGGMENAGGNPWVINCTFTENAGSSGNGGGMHNRSSNPTVTNSIFWNNVPPQIVNNSGSPTIAYCNVQGGHDGVGNMDIDPLFAPGPGGCFYLSRASAGQAMDSPCIDVGSGTVANLGVSTLTTRTDEAADTGIVDLGYHYPVTGLSLLRGDYDYNQLVNLADFAGLQNCLTGSGASSVAPCCRVFDFEPDEDVDLDDYKAFEAAMSNQ